MKISTHMAQLLTEARTSLETAATGLHNAMTVDADTALRRGLTPEVMDAAMRQRTLGVFDAAAGLAKADALLGEAMASGLQRVQGGPADIRAFDNGVMEAASKTSGHLDVLRRVILYGPGQIVDPQPSIVRHTANGISGLLDSVDAVRIG
jgi:hypothetical protein